MLVTVEATTTWKSKVDWRDVKGLVPASATIGTFTGALDKFVFGISIEYEEFLKPTDGVFPSTGALSKHIYDQLQVFDWETLLYSVYWL